MVQLFVDIHSYAIVIVLRFLVICFFDYSMIVISEYR